MRIYLLVGLLGIFLAFNPATPKAETLGVDAPEVQELIGRARTALIENDRAVFTVVIAQLHALMTGQALEDKIDPATAPAGYAERAAAFKQVVDSLMSGVVLEKLRDDIRVLGLSAAFEGVGVDTFAQVAQDFADCSKDPSDQTCPVGQEAVAWVEQAKRMSADQLRVAAIQFTPENRPGVSLKTLSTLQGLLLKQAEKLELTDQ